MRLSPYLRDECTSSTAASLSPASLWSVGARRGATLSALQMTASMPSLPPLPYRFSPCAAISRIMRRATIALTPSFHSSPSGAVLLDKLTAMTGRFSPSSHAWRIKPDTFLRPSPLNRPASGSQCASYALPDRSFSTLLANSARTCLSAGYISSWLASPPSRSIMLSKASRPRRPAIVCPPPVRNLALTMPMNTSRRSASGSSALTMSDSRSTS